jgi:hypothetical protein
VTGRALKVPAALFRNDVARMRIVLLVQMAVSRTKLVVTEIVEVKSISHLKKNRGLL